MSHRALLAPTTGLTFLAFLSLGGCEVKRGIGPVEPDAPPGVRQDYKRADIDATSFAGYEILDAKPTGLQVLSVVIVGCRWGEFSTSTNETGLYLIRSLAIDGEYASVEDSIRKQMGREMNPVWNLSIPAGSKWRWLHNRWFNDYDAVVKVHKFEDPDQDGYWEITETRLFPIKYTLRIWGEPWHENCHDQGGG